MPSLDSERLDRAAEKLGRVVEHSVAWLTGVLVPMMLAGYGLRCLLTSRALFVRNRPAGLIELHGDAAGAIGAFYLSLALLIHCQVMWGKHPRYFGFALIGKVIALAGIACSLFYLFFTVIVWG